LARYRGPVCRICRREGEKLFLKGQRCFTEKCAFDHRQAAPGQHGQRRAKITDFGVQLREKQKVKRSYGMLERQFKRFFHEAAKKRGITGEALLIQLECRLDNVIYRSGFATSRRQARQLVSHGHFRLNTKKVNIPSLVVKEGDFIAVRERSKNILPIKHAIEVGSGELPQWLEIDKEKLTSRVRALPTREDIKLPVKEQLIVELYSK